MTPDELLVDKPLMRLSLAHCASPPPARTMAWHLRPVVGQTPPRLTYRVWRGLARFLELPCRLFYAEAQDSDGAEIPREDAWVSWRPAVWAHRHATQRGPQPIYGGES